VLGRWPSWRRADDALHFLLVTAMIAACSPILGQMLFYRPYTGNYLFGLVFCIALLVPYRFALEREPAAATWHALWQAPAIFALGFAAGLSNEHTGPTVALLAIAATVVCARRAAWRPREWMIAGVLGIAAGGYMLFVAPGQDIRYNAIATQQSLLERVFSHGAYDTARILFAPYLFSAPILAWLVIAYVARRKSAPAPLSRALVQTIVGLAAGSAAILVTLLASPKIGPRLAFDAQVFLVAAAVGWIVPQLGVRWARQLAIGLAVATLVFVGWRCVRVLGGVKPEFDARLATLEHAPPDSVVELPTYSFNPSRRSIDWRWFGGDDLLIENLRNRVAAQFRLALIKMTPADGQRAPPPTGDEP
jgi:hypothetical protein